MLPRLVQRITQFPIPQQTYTTTCLRHLYSTLSIYDNIPKKLKKFERKPLVTSINELKRLGRKRRKERQNVKEIILQSPENGLLVQKLIPVAQQIYAARSEVLSSVSRLVNFIAIYSCRYL